MGRLHELQSQLLPNGKITDREVAAIRNCLQGEEKPTLDDVKFLVELLSNAREVSPSFDELFFPILKDVLLADGRITLDEQFYLLKMLYSDGCVRDSEKQFLRELRGEVNETTPEFDALCDEALNAPPTNWSLGGKSARKA
jgi:hypothetical protein